MISGEKGEPTAGRQAGPGGREGADRSRRQDDVGEIGRRDGDESIWPSLTSLVLGGTGAIGYHLVAALRRRGSRVKVLLRPGRDLGPLEDLGAEAVTGDLADPSSLDLALRGCDLLFHAAAPYPRTHFHRRRQAAAAAASMEVVLDVARSQVHPALLRLPKGHLRLREVEQAEMAALTLRHQPEREREFRQTLRQPGLLDDALAGRLNASLHPPLFETGSLPGLKRIVYVSSSTTIGRPRGHTVEGQPTRAANEWDRHDPIRASSPYFAMKETMESAATRAAVEGLPVVIANPTFCLDTHDARPTSGELIVAVARGRTPVYLPGTLNVVATRDVGEGLVLAASRGRTGQRYILGGENIPARDLLRLIAEEAGAPPPRLAIPFRLAEAVAWLTEAVNLARKRPWPLLPVSSVQMMRTSQPLDCRRAREELGMPQTPIRVAIGDALRWYRENHYL